MRFGTLPEYRIRRHCRLSTSHGYPEEVVTYEPQRKWPILGDMICVYVTIHDGGEYGDIREAWRAIQQDRRCRAKGSTEIVAELWPGDPIPDVGKPTQHPPTPDM